jgi:polyribonucleotide 5'-hydroxyl-kinase
VYGADNFKYVARSSGIIVNTPYQFSEQAGQQMLLEAIEAFQITVILVIGHERLYSDVHRRFRENEAISVIKLAKSGGVSTTWLA